MKNLVKNAALLTVADAAQKGAAAILALIIARYLGPTLYGQWATASAVGGLFMMVTAMGYEQEFTRRTGMDASRTGTALRLTLLAITISSVVAFLALAIFLASDLYSGSLVKITLLMMTGLVLGRFQLPFRHLCLVDQRSDITAIVQTVSTVFLIGITLLVILTDGSLTQILVVQLLVSALFSGVWFVWLEKRHPGLLAASPVSRADFLKFVKDAFPFALTNLLWIAYFNIGAFMLSLMKPPSEVGLYAGAYRIIAVNFILGYAVANTFTPVLFVKSRGTKAEFNHVAVRLLAALGAVAIPLAALLFVYSGPLVRGLIGEQYQAGVGVARILSISVLFRMFNFGLSEILTTSGRQRMRITLECGLVVLNVVLNFQLIPAFGALGAAMAMVGSEVALFLGSLIVWRLAQKNPPPR